jgi:hypothetical protein
MKNEILEELWAAKDEIGKEFKYDVVALGESLQESTNKIISQQPSKVAETNLQKYGKEKTLSGARLIRGILKAKTHHTDKEIKTAKKLIFSKKLAK